MPWYTITLRLFASVIIGFIIGYEREHHGHPAGVKTHIMVCLGAAVISIIEINIHIMYPNQDITRMMSQVIPGFGYYVVCIVTCVIVLLVLYVLRFVQKKRLAKSDVKEKCITDDKKEE